MSSTQSSERAIASRARPRFFEKETFSRAPLRSYTRQRSGGPTSASTRSSWCVSARRCRWCHRPMTRDAPKPRSSHSGCATTRCSTVQSLLRLRLGQRRRDRLAPKPTRGSRLVLADFLDLYLFPAVSPQGVKRAFLVGSAVAVRSEVVTQSLDQVGGASSTPIAVVISERCREGWDRHATLHRSADDPAPRGLSGGEDLLKKWGEHQVGEIGLLLVGLLNAVEELGPDDATTTPDRGEAAQVEIPSILDRTSPEVLKPLRVGNDLRGVKRIPDVGDQTRVLECATVTSGWPFQDLGCPHPLVLLAGQRPGEYRFCDRGQRHTEIERGLAGPPASTLLLGLVSDHIHKCLPRSAVPLRENIGRDLDEVGLKPSLIPFAEDRCKLSRRQPEGMAEEVVALGNQLDVRVFDAVVDHLDEVSGPIRSDEPAAWNTIDLGRDRSQNLLNLLV